MTPRSNRSEVRNPIAGDPAVRAIIEGMSPDARRAVRDILVVLSKKWRTQAQHSWSTHKAPQACYHKTNAVNARHLALALRTLR